MPSLWRRPLDLVFWLFFVTHIPATLLIDTQPLFPSLHPKFIRDLLQFHISTNNDVLMKAFLNDPSSVAWFYGFVVLELIFQVPAIFILAHSVWNNTYRSGWRRTLGLIYSSHVVTTVRVWSTIVTFLCSVVTSFD